MVLLLYTKIFCFLTNIKQHRVMGPLWGFIIIYISFTIPTVVYHALVLICTHLSHIPFSWGDERVKVTRKKIYLTFLCWITVHSFLQIWKHSWNVDTCFTLVNMFGLSIYTENIYHWVLINGTMVSMTLLPILTWNMLIACMCLKFNHVKYLWLVCERWRLL